MPTLKVYYSRKARGICVECEARVDEFARCRRCLDKRNYQKRLEYAVSRGYANPEIFATYGSRKREGKVLRL